MIWLQLGLAVLSNSLTAHAVHANVLETSLTISSNIGQSRNTPRNLAQLPTQQDLENTQPLPETEIPAEIEEPNLEESPLTPSTEIETPSGLPDIFTITEFYIESYSEQDELTIISTDDLREIELPFPQNFLEDDIQPFDEADNAQAFDEKSCEGIRSIASLEGQELSLEQLLQVSFAVAQEYACRGYSTSGAVIEIPQETRDGNGPINIRVIEGTLEDFQVDYMPEDIGNDDDAVPSQPSGIDNRLNLDYVRSRLGVAESKPLNVARLRENLQLLQLDPLIEGISAELSDGVSPGDSRLRVQFKEADSTELRFSLNNGRSPSVGTFERQVSFNERNVLGLGHNLNLALANTDGSTSFEASYRAPLNSQNGTIQAAFELTDSGVIEPPFDDIDSDGDSPDIESDARSVELTYRQPLLRRVRNGTFQELALGLTASWRDSKITLLDLPFPSPGADSNGRNRIAALRFFQEWSSQNAKEVIALRSQFNLGLDTLGSTVNNQIFGVENIPDSRFFSWQGQAQWIRVLAEDTLLLLRGNIQLADQTLLPAEQFSIGGLGSVRGYRQGARQRDNGVFASAEVQVPVMRIPEVNGLLQVAPFIDYGTAWNIDGSGPSPDTLASVGLGLQWRHSDNFSARLDYGIPLVSIDSRNRTWQENGFLFSVQYTP
ncbi:ShlB/FhaC/HecB family hemolysin secretion/activation protein [Leptolyngbya ectocarpi]|nr:ShlB/FhaC/HecB family hemolysin secretion/activation protein [Leptolyngbya ectocarpi]